jgi:hypothetical protein
VLQTNPQRLLTIGRICCAGGSGERARPVQCAEWDGTTLYFAGSSGGYQTLAYNAAAGTTLWARNNPAKATDIASAIAVSPRRTAIFVTGTDTGTTAGDYGTIAYHR